MATSVKLGTIEVDTKGVAACLAGSKELRQLITQQVTSLARRANATLTQRQPYPDYDSGVHTHRDGIPGGTVYTRSNHATYSNQKHNTLVSLLGSG